MSYTYNFIAYDQQGNLLPNAVGSFYADTDSALVNPLTVTTQDGVTTSSPTSNRSGLVYFTHDTEVRGYWKSGANTLRVSAWEAADAAAADAAAARVAAEAAAANTTAPTEATVRTVLETDLADSATPVAVAVSGVAQSVVAPIAPDNSARAVGKGELVANVRDFGATGNGIADDGAAVQAAFNNTASIKVRFTPGTYKINRLLTLPSNAIVQIDAGATLDFTAAPTGNLISATGAEGAKIPLTATAVNGSYTVTATGHGLIAGDMFRLGSNKLFDSHSTSIKCGELLVVSSVAADVITTTTPVIGQDYTVADTAVVSKITPVTNITIEGRGKIKGRKTSSFGNVGLRVTLGRKIRVRGVTFADIDDRHVAFADCIDAWADDVTFDWAVTDSTAYGISFMNATQDSGCRYSTFLNVRHSLSTNNETAVAGVTRRIRFAFNDIRQTSIALGGSQGGGDSIDTHTAAEDIWIEYNKTSGSTGQGINFEARSGRIIGNVVRGCVSNGIAVHNESDLPGRIVVTDNDVSHAGSYGISVKTGARGTTANYELIIVHRNVINKSASTPLVVGLSGTGRPVEHGVNVKDNTMLNCGGTQAMVIQQAAGIIQSGNRSFGGPLGFSVTELGDTAPNDDPGYLYSAMVSGVATVSPNTRRLFVDTEASASTGALTSITGGSRGQIIVLSTFTSSRDVSIAQTVGNLRLTASIALNSALSSVTLAYNGASWIETCRAIFPDA